MVVMMEAAMELVTEKDRFVIFLDNGYGRLLFVHASAHESVVPCSFNYCLSHNLYLHLPIQFTSIMICIYPGAIV